MPSIAAGLGARVPGEVSKHTPSSPRRAAAASRCFARVPERRSFQADLQVLWEAKLGHQKPHILRKPGVGNTTER